MLPKCFYNNLPSHNQCNDNFWIFFVFYSIELKQENVYLPTKVFANQKVLIEDYWFDLFQICRLYVNYLKYVREIK